MGKQLTNLKRRSNAKKRLDQIDARRDQTLVIHYSCESFYDIKDGRTPRVTSIAIRNFDSGQTDSFAIHKSAEQNEIPAADISVKYDHLEKMMLDEFFSHLTTLPVQTFIHWNMRDINYGFQAIEHRYKVLGGTPVTIDDGRKLDLARTMVALFGVGYAPHGEFGRLHSIMELNSITARDALPGEAEATAFKNAEFVKLHQSTLRKVDVIANLLERTLDGSLKTASNWRERHGIHPAALTEYLTEHPVWGLVVAAGVIIGIVSGLAAIF